MTSAGAPSGPTGKALGPILLSGASSGIGLHLSRRLAGLGHQVWAGARRAEHLERLGRIEGVTPVLLDVCEPAQIAALRARLEAHGEGLDGLVNNAGVGDLGPLASFDDQDLRQLFEVNVFGPHRLTNALAPLLVASRGRVVNIGSQGGSVAKRYFGPYCMSKHALEAYSVALAEELEPHGVRVAIVQPGGVVSEIGEKSLPRTVARLERVGSPFREEALQLLAALRQPSEPDPDEPESELNRKPSSPEIVALAVLDALFAERPRRRYLVGTRWEGQRVLDALVERLLDANDCPSLGYTRDQLVALLDRQLRARAD